MAACERFLKSVWPHVGRQRTTHAGDFTGTWDLNVEATIVPWDKIWIKLRQSEGDAAARGLELFCVWKKRNRREDHQGNRPVDAGEGAVVMLARQFFPLVARLEELERRETDAEQEFERGFRLGQKEAV